MQRHLNKITTLTTRFIFTHENEKARNAKGVIYRQHKAGEQRRKMRILE